MLAILLHSLRNSLRRAPTPLLIMPHRHGSNRPNLQRPLPMHYKRKKMLAVCLPRYPEGPKECGLGVGVERGSFEGKPYHQFLARELRRSVESHPMVALFHTNSFTQAEYMKFRLTLHSTQFPLRVQYKISKHIARAALAPTPYAPLLPFITTHTALGFSPAQDVPTLLKVLKKMPQFILIAVAMEGRLLHKDDVERVAKMPGLETARSGLCSTLERAGGGAVVGSIGFQGAELARSLDLYSRGG